MSRALFLTGTTALSLAALSLATAVRGETWRVDPNGTGDAPSLQAAADSAVSGDTVLVAPGTYAEHVSVSVKAIVFRGESGAEATVLDGGYSGRILTLLGGGRVVLEGLTFYRGRAGGVETNSTGGAIAAYAVPLSIRDCVFRNNLSNDAGGAVYASIFAAAQASGVPVPAPLTVTGTLFEANFAGGDGGAIFSDDVNTDLTQVTFRGNSGVLGGAVSLGDGDHHVVDCSFRENNALNGGGLHLAGTATADVEGTLFADNRAENFGGGLRAAFLSGLTLFRCWFLGNQAYRGAGTQCLSTPVVADHVFWYGGTATDGGGGIYLDRVDNTAFNRCTWLGNSAARGASLTAVTSALTVARCLVGDESVEAVTCGGSTVESDCNAGGAVTGGCLTFSVRTTVKACPSYPEALCTLPTVPDCGTVGHADVACPESACGTPARPVTWGRLKTLFRE